MAISPSLEPNEKLSNTANQILNPDVWNIGERGESVNTVVNEGLDPKFFIAN